MRTVLLRLKIGGLAVLLASCSSGSAGTALPPAGFSTGAADLTGEQLATLVIHIRIPKGTHLRTGARPSYVSPSTQGMTIAFNGPSQLNETVGLTPSSPGCSSATHGTTCTVSVGLKPCPEKRNCYAGSIVTYNAVSCSKNVCRIPPGTNVLSANQDLAFAIVAGRKNTLKLALDGVPAAVALLPNASSTLVGNSTDGFTISKCVTAPQSISVVGVDADGNDIVGPGAPTSPALRSADPTHLAVATPPPGSNTFRLVPPASLVPATIPNAGAVVHLTASIRPLSHSGAPVPHSYVDVTFNGNVCGIMTEYRVPTPMSSPAGINPGPDGALWFAEQSSNKVGRITTNGVMTETAAPSGSEPLEIVTGADGALWFTELQANAVSRITTKAAITNQYPLTTPNSYPLDIIQGPDGALWFTGLIGNTIGRMTTSGANAETPIPTSASEPFIIVVGPDNALWFTERNGNEIGRLTTVGAITETPIPTGNSQPTGIATGPDGALWFTESAGNKIGRLTTNGSMTETPVPTASSLPLIIVAGPDGALWFTECLGNKIGRITTDGTITNEYPVPTSGSNPAAITTGPDGALWFTECLGNKVGRLQ
jgi:virginiamycin B lyase